MTNKALDTDEPEYAIVRGIGRLNIADCTAQEVRLARLLYEPWHDERLEAAYPTERSIALKQARMALAYAAGTTARPASGPVDESEDVWIPIETGDELPYHLREDAEPLAECEKCHRQSWDADEIGRQDMMTQPTGRPCGGTMVRYNVPPQMGAWAGEH
jgi:hypothetical protein